MSRNRLVTAAIATVACLALSGTAVAAPPSDAGPSASSAKKKKVKRKTFTVCKRGCKIRTVKAAVSKASKLNKKLKKSKRYRVTIKVKPGTYKEAVIAQGHHLDNLAIVGATKNAKRVVFDGQGLPTPGNGVNEVGIFGIDVDGMRIQNLTVKNYAYTGVKVEGLAKPCDGFTMGNLRAEYNRTYGLYSFNCKGGKMSDSVAFGQADAGYYVGSTPDQAKPKWTILENLDAHLNVLGYSGTNSKYVHIRKSAFYNNGAGIVPNTLDSQEYEPNAAGKITNNKIFWNNLNYYNGDWSGVPNAELPADLQTGAPNAPLASCTNPSPACSPIDPTHVGRLSRSPVQQFYPYGIGVILHGSDGWQVEENDIFGHNSVGVAVVTDPTNADGNAVAKNNQVKSNLLGRANTDPNGRDFFFDGAGTGNCFSGNSTGGGSPSVVNESAPAVGNGALYAACPGGYAGGSSPNGGQFNFTIDLVLKSITQQCDFFTPAGTAHPAFSWNGTAYTPYEVTRPVNC